MSKAFGFVAYGGPEQQEFLDRPTPEPGPGAVLIEVRAAGVNPADWKKRQGWFGTEAAPPLVMGSEAAGVVTAVGEGVQGFAVGDEVFGIAPGGAFAEETLLAARTTARKPADIGFAQAAALPVAAATAYDALNQLDLRAGQTLLIVGVAGGVGSAAAQIAHHRGVTVLGTAGEGSAGYVRALGATPVRYGPGVADRLRGVAPEGVDAVLDLIGGDAVRDVAGVLREPGRLVSTADPATAAELGGAYVKRDGTAGPLTAVAELVAAGKLDPNITASYPLERAAEAMAEVESGHARGKLILEMSRP
ncbi:NADP-dependent oxidoreductase [Streptomyces sp. TLI_171]|uniref:NADP-dependent oxidoreductase n=1 Tax=Streptomyces sp. TLI_171 TaxID=1938859 RepID=UPI000C18D65F|nr:NADP-dependent oxidoreductase [Streptomyces sp. TLI_171]RKE22627.1 NADPH:quinone reductase-like Zn-dependent oxidoreductase [Streptomyces sp. TLI_171]